MDKIQKLANVFAMRHIIKDPEASTGEVVDRVNKDLKSRNYAIDQGEIRQIVRGYLEKTPENQIRMLSSRLGTNGHEMGENETKTLLRASIVSALDNAEYETAGNLATAYLSTLRSIVKGQDEGFAGRAAGSLKDARDELGNRLMNFEDKVIDGKKSENELYAYAFLGNFPASAGLALAEGVAGLIDRLENKLTKSDGQIDAGEFKTIADNFDPQKPHAAALVLAMIENINDSKFNDQGLAAKNKFLSDIQKLPERDRPMAASIKQARAMIDVMREIRHLKNTDVDGLSRILRNQPPVVALAALFATQAARNLEV